METKTNVKETMIQFAERWYKDVTHPLAVANQFDELSEAWIVGLFHDALEDTKLRKNTLAFFLFDFAHELPDVDLNKVYYAITSLTRRRSETYTDYIERLKRDGGLPVQVKLADLEHNLSRVDTLRPSMKQRYEKAKQVLTN